MKTLDLEAVQAFVLIADLRSFTRAAQAIDSTQAAVSLKIKRLEERMGRRLVERTPRVVRLSSEGLAFLDAARDLVSSHERAVRAFSTTQRKRLVIGISHLMVGPELPALLRSVSQQDGSLMFELRVAGSREIIASFDEGALDAAIVLRQEDDRREGESLFRERFAWVACTDWLDQNGSDGPLRLATQGETCSIRKAAVRALNDAGMPWTEVFIGKGAAVLGAAAAAGLAVAVMARRAAPAGTIDIGAKLSLPPLPPTEAVMYSTVRDAHSRAALKTLATTLRGTLGK
jgi:DNA-binding transcriptional LysR family regulator